MYFLTVYLFIYFIFYQIATALPALILIYALNDFTNKVYKNNNNNNNNNNNHNNNNKFFIISNSSYLQQKCKLTEKKD